MKKVILIDGNNLLFRSYYATAYTGNIMRNSKGFPTNALYGFVNMINKIIQEEDPKYIMVAFDIGKTFRHEAFKEYKGKRSETPDELKQQFPIAKKILTAMGIKYYELEGYEADDIIGTFAKEVDNNDEYIATIVSSDKDLLQLISNDVEVKLLKSKDYLRLNPKSFYDIYHIEPIRMIDLKALMGDPSDNIPGVKGIGEKTAIKLLEKYETIDNLYDHLEEITGAVKTKLEEHKEEAFMSKELATIYRDVPMEVNLDNITYNEANIEELISIYTELEFQSFLKKTISNKRENTTLSFKVVKSISEIKISSKVAVYLDMLETNYHHGEVLGMAVYNNDIAYYIPIEILKQNPSFLTDIEKITYDLKKLYVVMKKNNINLDNTSFDVMIAGYLLNYNVKDDISYLASLLGYNLSSLSDKKDYSFEDRIKNSVEKAKFIYEVFPNFYNELEKEQISDLYFNIEHPLTIVLGNMEYEGIKVDKNVLIEMGKDIQIKLELISKDIYNYAGVEFNINSPKQLGEILFDKLKLPYAKKNKTGYVTDVNVLNKLIDYPIVEKILEYRMLSKLYSTYIEGIINTISEDGKIHTIYTQTLTRTGRLSSIEPNLQNIPIRSEYGKLIRKAFLPNENSLIMSADYSQIELRMFAHLSQVPDLIEAFNNNMDIHTRTAMDIFKVEEQMVTNNMRRKAKAVNFGILYGISSYGLSEDLKIKPSEAKQFIDTYFATYPGVKKYMEKEIKEAYEHGYVKTIMNRKRIIEELNNTNHVIRKMGERMALNTPIQGSSADILKMAMIKINEEFENKKLQSKMILQVHDELIFNTLIEEKEEVEQIVTKTMENIYKLNVPLVVDVEFGNNWYEAK